jgi:hypothetical protein
MTALLEMGVDVAGTDPRQAILDRLKEMQWSRYRLVKELSGKLSPNMIYSYLRGEMDLTGKNLAKMFDKLGISLQAEKKKRSKSS